MTNLIFYGYYYRYSEHRKQVNILLATGNLTEAKSKLDSSLAEHNIKYSITFLQTRRDFNYGEYLTMEHAKRHLDMMLLEGADIPFEGRDGEIWTQKRKIIEILDHAPTNSDL